jgi:hypothetical protein
VTKDLFITICFIAGIDSLHPDDRKWLYHGNINAPPASRVAIVISHAEPSCSQHSLPQLSGFFFAWVSQLHPGEGGFSEYYQIL